MTILGQMIYDDGIEKGIEQEARENAKNLFKNGATYQLVRCSIHSITDEDLMKIYEEVNQK